MAKLWPSKMMDAIVTKMSNGKIKYVKCLVKITMWPVSSRAIGACSHLSYRLYKIFSESPLLFPEFALSLFQVGASAPFASLLVKAN
jgi:hypothetical protein